MAWDLPQKRAELLESARVEVMLTVDTSNVILADMFISPLGKILLYDVVNLLTQMSQESPELARFAHT